MMTWKELMKEICEVKGYDFEISESVVRVGSFGLSLNKDELVELASRLTLTEADVSDIIAHNYYMGL